EDLWERRTALEADLLAAIEALGLADLPEGPPETRAVCEGDLEPARSQADRRRPAGGAPAVEVIARECARHFLPLRESDVGAEEITSASVEAELPAAEARIRDHELLLACLEERVVEREGQGAQERGHDEDLDEHPCLAAEREADSSPRGAAQAITPGPDH